MTQSSIFDFLYKQYKITKPIRLIELFAGYGSQHLALSYLGLDVKGHKIVEWAVPSIQAYKDLHYGDIDIDHTQELTDDEIINALVEYGISTNYNEPMTKAQIQRKGGVWCRTVYNNIKNTNNLVNISNVKATDLEITDTDKYDYILTYSFPCQDLSLAGKRAGMDENSETRSSLLWQVQRLLDELKDLNQLPQVLLMENVPQVMAQDNLQNMEKWDHFLSLLGYKSYIKNLIATDYGIPQIRNRTFMISILGDYSYTFPKPVELTTNTLDYLEEEIDEKLILSDKMVEALSTNPKSGYPRKEQFLSALKNPNEKGIANTITTRAGSRPSDNFIIIAEDTKKGYVFAELGDGVYINRPHQKRGVVQKGKIQTLKTTVDDIAVVIKDTRNLKEKLCDDLIESGIVKEGDVVNHSYTNSKKKPNSRLELEDFIERTDGIMPTLTTRPDILGVVIRDYKTGKLKLKKLSTRERFRLMGVKDEDFDKIKDNQSNSSLYHLAGDSIVVNVLMAIFKQLL